MRARRILLPALAALLLLQVAGCLTHRPPTRYDRPARIGLTLVRDDVFTRAVHPMPRAVGEPIARALAERNLTAVPVTTGPLFGELGRVRDTDRRLAVLTGGAATVGYDYPLLVETRVRYYSQLSGVYRWSVSVKLSMAALGAEDKAVTDSFELPATLRYEHEREDEALASVAGEIARRAAALVDEFMAGRDPAVSGAAASAQIAADSIYFVLVDRFHNGDPRNDGAIDPRDPAAWHGGDLKGVIQRLDYLAGLGVKTIWLSPVFATRHEGFLGHGAFHGYWVEDLGRIDPRFGDEAELRELVAEAHRRGLRVLLDLVVNHVGYDAPMLREHPDWFHPARTIEDWNDPLQIVNYQVHGLPDLAQENPAVHAYLLGVSRGWLERAGVDGYRLDAVKHVPLEFWGRFNGELAATRPGVVLLGELYDGAPQVLDRVQREGKFTHMFDFPTAFALRDVFCAGRPAGRLGAVLSARRLFSNPAALVTFLDNHDMPRIRTACGGDALRVGQALTAQVALEGIPAFTYGTEAGLQGDGEPANRGDMVFDDPAAAELKTLVTRLLALRAAHPALAKGATRVVSLDDGLLGFVRVAGDEAALVAVNGAAGPRRLAVPAPLLGAALADGLDGGAVAAGEELIVPPGATRLLIARAPSPGAFRTLEPTPERRRPVELSVPASAAKDGESLLAVGGGPELGNWAPGRGVPFQRRGGALVASLSLPVGYVYAFKLVGRPVAGEPRWETGEDRYLFVDDSEQPLAVGLPLVRED